MAGEIWRGTLQAGLESTAGTAVPATRVMYVETDSTLSTDSQARPHEFMTTTRDNTRALTVGPTEAGGQFKLPISGDEIIEFLLMGISGAVTPTTPALAVNTRQWVFRPANTLGSATLEWSDGARVWQGSGYRVGGMTFDGSVGADNTVTFDLFGQNVVPLGAITGALAQRTPSFFEGWETRIYLDSFLGTPGSTAVAGLLLNWSVKLDNQMTRKYTAANTLGASDTPIGSLMATAELTFEAASASAVSEFNLWRNGSASPTKRILRLEFGNNTPIEGPTTSVGTTTAITSTGATATYTVANTLAAGNVVNITGATPAAYNGVYNVVTAAAGNFTTFNPAAPGTAASVQGTVTGGVGWKQKVMVDMPGSWTSIDLGGTDEGTRTYKMGYQYVYDPTNAFGVSVTCIGTRTAAF